MDGRTFRRLCANVDRLSLGQIRDLRRKLRELDARRDVLARVDARGQALEACVHCGAAALGFNAHGPAKAALQGVRAHLLGGDRYGARPRAAAREAVRGAERLAGGGAELVPPAGGAARGGQDDASSARMPNRPCPDRRRGAPDDQVPDFGRGLFDWSVSSWGRVEVASSARSVSTGRWRQ